MSTSENTALARRWFEEVWNRRRSETVGELMAEECAGHMEGAEITGPKDFLAVREALLGALPDVQVVVESTIAEGDAVAVRWSASGTHRGDHMGPPASGRRVSFRGISWIRFDRGRVVEGWDSWNLGKLLSEMSDLVPPEESSRRSG